MGVYETLREKEPGLKFWERLKAYFYRRRLTEALGQLKTTRAVTNLEDAKSVGIIYDCKDTKNDVIISKFAEQLRGGKRQNS